MSHFPLRSFLPPSPRAANPKCRGNDFALGIFRVIDLTSYEVTTLKCEGHIAADGEGPDAAMPSCIVIDSHKNLMFADEDQHRLAKIAAPRLGIGFDAMWPFLQWQPTRQCHWSTPEWSRDAVLCVLQVACRARTPGSKTTGWLGRVPMLPTQLWLLIISLVVSTLCSSPRSLIALNSTSVRAQSH